MRRACCSFLVIALFLFSLTLPFLHLHPAAYLNDHHLVTHHHEYVPHSHLPGAHAKDPIQDSVSSERENQEIETQPVEFVVLRSLSPSPQVFVLAEVNPRLRRQWEQRSLIEPDPDAQPPPGFATPSRPRGPPA